MNNTGIYRLFLNDECYEKLILEGSFLHAPCLKLLGVKLLGYLLVLSAVFVKVPQIVKLLRAWSGDGINIVSPMLNAAASTCSGSYSFARGYPISSYGDTMLLMIQNISIATLVVLFKTGGAVTTVFLLLFLSAAGFLLSPLAPIALLTFLVRCNTAMVASSKLLQALTNWRQGHTGQLSALTVFMLTGRALGRLFTSVQETGDPALILFYTVSSLCNGLVALQILYYWNVKPKKD